MSTWRPGEAEYLKKITDKILPQTSAANVYGPPAPQGMGGQQTQPSAAAGTAAQAGGVPAPTWQKRSDGNVGVRDYLTNTMGISDSRIGWDNAANSVTLDGNKLYTPSILEDGRSYAKSGAELAGAVHDYFTGQGKNVVKVTDYAAQKGLPFKVTYNNGLVSIGGQTVKPLYEDNGYAYMDSADLDRAVAQAQQAAGIQDRNAIRQQYDEKYSPYYDKLLDAIVNRAAFNYDPDSDVVYQAYKNQYNREGDRSMRDAMGAMAGMTGGYTNSAAVTAGAQQRQYWDDKLMDRIPELANLAYERYLGDFNMNNQALNSVMGVDDMQFNRAYGVNDDTINDVRYNNKLATERDDKAYERNWEQEARDYNRRLDKYLDPYTVEAARLANETVGKQNYGLDLANKDTERNAAWQVAQQNGYFNPYDSVYGFDVNVSPWNYVQTGTDIETDANKQLATHNSNLTKEQMAYENSLNKDFLKYQYDLGQQYGSKSSSGKSASGGRSASGNSKSSSGGSASGSGTQLYDSLFPAMASSGNPSLWLEMNGKDYGLTTSNARKLVLQDYADWQDVVSTTKSEVPPSIYAQYKAMKETHPNAKLSETMQDGKIQYVIYDE